MSDFSANVNFVVKETATINWTVDDFSKIENQVYSEYFSPPNNENKFRLYLNSKTTFFDSEQVCIYLRYYENENELLIRYRVSILNANSEKQYNQEYYWDYKKANSNNRYRNLNFNNFIDYTSCHRFLVNGNMILNCQVDLLEIRSGQTNLQNDYQALLENSEFSDVVLFVKDKEFKVHKNILAARSKVFRAMFSNDLEEKKQNRVEITDVEVEVFEHLLRYIYTGKIPEMDEYALELFVAADKAVCEQYLSSNFAIKSVVNVLVIADMHYSNELKSKCIEFITSNSDEVKRTDSWKEMKSRPVLLMELFDKLAVKMKSLLIKS